MLIMMSIRKNKVCGSREWREDGVGIVGTIQGTENEIEKV